MQAALARNLRLYPWFLAFTYESFSHAVWYLYLYSYKGLSLAEMAWLTLLGDGVIALSEVPTGWLADRLGRRRSMITGILLQIASFLLFIYGDSFWVFWLAMAVCGLGDTFRSGADRALVYDSALALDQSARYRSLVGHGTMVAVLVGVVAGVSGGYLASRVHWHVPFWCDIGLSLLGLAAVLRMTEAPMSGEDPEDADDAAQEAEAQSGGAAPQPAMLPAVARPRARGFLLVLPVLILAMVFSISPELSHFLLPAELEASLALKPELLAWLYAGFEILEALGARLGGSPRWHSLRTLAGSALLMALLLACASLRSLGGAAWLIAYLAARGAMDFLYGLAEPLFSEELNRRVASNMRATALSWLSAVRLVLPLGLLPLAAELQPGLGYPGLYLAFACLALLLTVPAALWLLRQTARPAAKGKRE
ncbi:MFS transporter [bacterium]|nr:MFS transporter [bacterium]